MKKAVIIGAGQTGRGFIAPILLDNQYRITFLDKNPKLINQLRMESRYSIDYFQNEKEKRSIDCFDAIDINNKEMAVNALAEADIITTSVFATNIADLVPTIMAATKISNHKLTIVCCENGINVKKPLCDAQIDAFISEGIIFCTTLQQNSEKLDLLSQNYPELPVDGSIEGLMLDINGMPMEKRFSDLIHRKIYTYNFISAIISYFGAYLNFEIYADAANDKYISDFIDRIIQPVSAVIANKYQVNLNDQINFTTQAIKKFKNREIIDTIIRNARQADRKLGEEERMLAPMRFSIAAGMNTQYFETVIAAAMFYGKKNEQFDVSKMNARLKKIGADAESITRVFKYFSEYDKGTPINSIFEVD